MRKRPSEAASTGRERRWAREEVDRDIWTRGWRISSPNPSRIVEFCRGKGG